MSFPLWVYELADTFWMDAGEEEGFPRRLRRAIARALPLTVVSLPRLRVCGMDTWLRRQAIPCELNVADRPLRACLIARHGHGMIFLDGSDQEDEQRFSLAHELAHFLRDYRQPRRLASERLGSGVLEVLDGERPARQDERIHALLTNVQIGYHVHLMERGSELSGRRIDLAEREADRLAFELLAPEARIREEAGQGSIEALLVMRYGLPQTQARQYAALLAPTCNKSSSFVSRLKLVR